VSGGPARPRSIRTEALVRFTLAREANIRLIIFDLHERGVAVLADGPHAAGEHSARRDARGVPSGVYLCRLEERRADASALGSGRMRKLVVVR
jgi:hypothetical protein